MKRREFLKSSALIAAGAALAPFGPAHAGAAPQTGSRQYFEMRLYHFRQGPMSRRFDEYCRDAAIPATNRAGIEPVGVFSVMLGPDTPATYVLIPHPSMESVGTLGERLRDDAEYQKAGAAFIDAPPTDPPYIRVESSLMAAFSAMPRLEVPRLKTEGKSRLFELRIYESHSKKANRKKIEMFNTAEIGIFRRVGLTPVFFGETLIGSKAPNLTYLLVFENAEEREKNWAVFRADPEWAELRSRPEYANIVSNISNVLLRPAAYSQV